ncbi:C4-dicarboxylate ABC transporter permease [Aureimonas flava]|uniref:C4-dicarboxylate ABC transporter permease n=1 Tax=Aureimonas flava TaxID=2320271 RepID=A0A3A1WIJ8_9HYPH|nr:tripartite tricarboxylate transporter permease [Aureimonas flava]RIX97983.1 C4-dicarboxylate ABC transporter permease [Aureimonas flava]
MAELSAFLTVFTHPELFAVVALGTFAGIYIGAIPGLSVTMAVSILISFTFSWNVLPALALMIGIYMGGVYGGSRTAILLNIPGAPSAIATALDGYPMAQRGEAGEAIGITTTMSFIGGFVGILVLAVAAPFVSDFALAFQPRDYMLLAVLGLLLVGSLSSGSLVKGIFCGALGLMLGTVGMDPLTFTSRFTFDLPLLQTGISFIAVMIGLFGVSEALAQLHHMDKAPVRQTISKIVPSFATIRKHLPLSMQTSALGVVIGALPGTGGDIAALMAYDHAKRTTRNPERPFGQGAIEGLVAPETANNAAVGGAFIPMMTLGIPGDAVTAIMIGALFIHGLNPGPMLMVEQPDMFWFIVGSLTLANVCMLAFGLTGIKLFVRIVEMPRAVLVPLILLLSIVGAYAVNNSVADVYWMLAFGVFGYFLKLYGYPLGPIILGVILSRLLDDNWRRAIISERESLPGFFLGILTSPLSLALFLSVVFIFVSQTPPWKRWRARRAALGAAGDPGRARAEGAGDRGAGA